MERVVVVRHDEDDLAFCGAAVEERKDMRMLERGSDLGLLEKARRAECGGELGAEDFKHDLAVVEKTSGEIDSGQGSGAELAIESVAIRREAATRG